MDFCFFCLHETRGPCLALSDGLTCFYSIVDDLSVRLFKRSGWPFVRLQWRPSRYIFFLSTHLSFLKLFAAQFWSAKLSLIPTKHQIS